VRRRDLDKGGICGSIYTIKGYLTSIRELKGVFIGLFRDLDKGGIYRVRGVEGYLWGYLGSSHFHESFLSMQNNNLPCLIPHTIF